MQQNEHDMARTVLKNLQSEKYKDKNYLFLEKFDLGQVPGYLEIVGKPLDLKTVTQNFEAGMYKSLDEVWADITATFENAIKYHGDRPTKWIAKFASDMIKAFNREKKKAEKSAKGGTSSSSSNSKPKLPTLKIKIGKQQTAGPSPTTTPPVPSGSNFEGQKSGKVSATTSAGASASDAAASGPTSAAAVVKPKKNKIKLKLVTKKTVAPASVPATGSAASSGGASALSSSKGGETQAPPSVPLPTTTITTVNNSTTAAELKPPIKAKSGSKKIKLKLSKSSKSATAASGANTSTSSTISTAASAAKSSSTTSSSSNSNTPTASASATPSSNASAAKATPSSTTTGPGGSKAKSSGGTSGGPRISLSLSGPSRGKELPKAVAEAQATFAGTNNSGTNGKAASASSSTEKIPKSSGSNAANSSGATSTTKSNASATTTKSGSNTSTTTTKSGSNTSSTATMKSGSNASATKTKSGSNASASTKSGNNATASTKNGNNSTASTKSGSNASASTKSGNNATASTKSGNNATASSKSGNNASASAKSGNNASASTKGGNKASAASTKSGNSASGAMTTSGSKVSAATTSTDNNASATAASDNNASATTTKKKRMKKTLPTKEGGATTKGPSAGAMSPAQHRCCSKVLLGLKRRQVKSVNWFLHPVTDKAIIQDYRSKIKHPMDLGKINTKLENMTYKNLTDFCLDLRRIFANCLRFNTSAKDYIRSAAVEVLSTAEDLMANFLGGELSASYPRLLYCWKQCMDLLGNLYNIVNPSDAQPTVLYFLHPVSVYCGGQFPQDYTEKITKPMDFGTVTANLLEAKYQSVTEFVNDCKLIVQNCNMYYNGRDDGKLFVEQANRLGTIMNAQLDQMLKYDKSAKGSADRAKFTSQSPTLARPPTATLVSILDELRSLKYTDKATKITEQAMGPFEKPEKLYPDFLQHITEPMDLQTIERKARTNVYITPEDMEFDLSLAFKNIEKYSSKKNSDHLDAMTKFAVRHFRRIFYARIKAFEEPSPSSSTKESGGSPGDGKTTSAGPPSKKMKMDPAAATSGGGATGKATPRISINLSSSTAATTTATSAPSRSEKTKSPKQGNSSSKKGGPASSPKGNQPVPLHIAITRVKESFPPRRAVKTLQSWEADCARYFKELLRHPWLSAARPKFIFHVPVPVLFPELSQAYAAKIRKPMDLTTVECNLLVGGRYGAPEDMIEDIALTFSNAIRFNKDGRDIGDPLSCAYYDASVHLLRYARWLSLELLSSCVDESDHVDVDGADGLPPFSWRLTTGNRLKAQDEQKQIVLKEPIEKSLEGDRLTWHESECEKLLKVLRQQSDIKYATYFIQPDYPPDYTAFVSRPMDREKIERNLKKRQYDKFEDIIEDLRLIFKNAIKYNGRLRGTDTISGRVCEAAEYMSTKLENAIRKFMLSVGDRIERERIDHANAEREMEAAERAEEAQIRAAWKKDAEDGSSGKNEGSGSSSHGGRFSAGQKIRPARRPLKNKTSPDFEIPYFDDEDDAQHERSFIEFIKMQKSMFEKQRQELMRMRQASMNVGTGIFARLVQHNLASQWMDSQQTAPIASQPQRGRNAATLSLEESKIEPHGDATGSSSAGGPLASAVRSVLDREDRVQIRLSLTKPANNAKKSKRGMKRTILDF